MVHPSVKLMSNEVGNANSMNKFYLTVVNIAVNLAVQYF